MAVKSTVDEVYLYRVTFYNRDRQVLGKVQVAAPGRGAAYEAAETWASRLSPNGLSPLVNRASTYTKLERARSYNPGTLLIAAYPEYAS